MLSTPVLLIFVVVFALGFDYINGFHDTANAIATSVSTRALSPRNAVIMSATMNFVGALYSTGVAQTIAKDIVSAKIVSEDVMIAALLGAILWNLLTWYLGIPSSSSHAIIGGVMGVGIAKAGFDALQMKGIEKIILALIFSPIIGLILGYIIMRLFYFFFGSTQPSKVNNRFRKVQILTAGLLAFNHGANDAQKSMGIITLSLFSAGILKSVDVPLWVKIACALAMAFGTAGGGWRIIHTMGAKIFKLEPINGVASDLASSAVIWTATVAPGLHLPVSTTHVVSGAIMGVGSAKRVSAVRWGVAQQMVVAWVLTIPAAGLMGGLIYELLHLFNI